MQSLQTNASKKKHGIAVDRLSPMVASGRFGSTAANTVKLPLLSNGGIDICNTVCC